MASKVVFDVTAEDRPGDHHDEAGLIRLETLCPYLPTGDAEFYSCGPEGFGRALQGILDRLNVPATRRFTETFGPSQSFAPVLAAEQEQNVSAREGGISPAIGHVDQRGGEGAGTLLPDVGHAVHLDPNWTPTPYPT